MKSPRLESGCSIGAQNRRRARRDFTNRAAHGTVLSGARHRGPDWEALRSRFQRLMGRDQLRYEPAKPFDARALVEMVEGGSLVSRPRKR